MLTLFCLRRNKCGAPPGGCRGTAGSGVTSWTGRGGLSASVFRLAIRLSHIKDTSSMRCSTCQVKIKKIHKYKSGVKKTLKYSNASSRKLTFFFLHIFLVKFRHCQCNASNPLSSYIHIRAMHKNACVGE